MNLNKSSERVLWLLVLIAVGVVATYAANYVRDHEVYKEAAGKCSAETSVLGQEIENLKAENQKKEQHIESLKALPL